MSFVIFSFVAVFLKSCAKEGVFFEDMQTIQDDSALSNKSKNKITPELAYAYNSIVDFLFKSKRMLESDSERFVAMCEKNDAESLLTYMYGESAAFDVSQKFSETVEIIIKDIKVDDNVEPCCGCMLPQLPSVIRKLEFDMVPVHDFDGEALALCLAECALLCAEIPAFWNPIAFFACVSICTAVCYGVTTADVIAPYYPTMY